MKNTLVSTCIALRKLFSCVVIFLASVGLLIAAPGVAQAQTGEPTPKLAGDLVFFEGNDCTQNIVFSYDSSKPANDNCQQGGECNGDNDEARSLKILGLAQSGTLIGVFDDPNGGTQDDFSYILTQGAPLGPDVCVGTFEKSTTTPRYLITHQHNNGLDGKISHVTIIPNYGR
ncbi:hypothetical protein A6770_06030 [Nostoc minutum NIES-26]|uniref:Uncharacterized protein n=1 Tax=Nostoc minutum NIES-26 TaxID=1844469 RepID=A0A367Q6K6_9NOSO|nr:hypothetical protein A6770_06030 [Nostoc minutum NIES-26]